MFGFHFAIYGEMLTYGFLKKKPSFVSPVNDKIGDAHLGVDFFFAKKSTRGSRDAKQSLASYLESPKDVQIGSLQSSS